MTDQEKKEFLLKALEEKGWEMSYDNNENGERYTNLKNGMELAVVYSKRDKCLYLSIFINDEHLLVIEFEMCEVFSDHIEFTLSLIHI